MLGSAALSWSMSFRTQRPSLVWLSAKDRLAYVQHESMTIEKYDLRRKKTSVSNMGRLWTVLWV